MICTGLRSATGVQQEKWASRIELAGQQEPVPSTGPSQFGATSQYVPLARPKQEQVPE